MHLGENLDVITEDRKDEKHRRAANDTRKKITQMQKTHENTVSIC